MPRRLPPLLFYFREQQEFCSAESFSQNFSTQNFSHIKRVSVLTDRKMCGKLIQACFNSLKRNGLKRNAFK